MREEAKNVCAICTTKKNLFFSFARRLFCALVFPPQRLFCSLPLFSPLSLCHSPSSLLWLPPCCACFLFFSSLSLTLVRPALCPIFFDWEVLVCVAKVSDGLSTNHRSHPRSLLSARYHYVFIIRVDTATSRNTRCVLSKPVRSKCISTIQWYSPLLLLLFCVRYRHPCQT